VPDDRYALRAHNLGSSEMAPLALMGTSLPTLAGSRLRVAALEGSRADAELIHSCMTLMVTNHEVAGRYLNDGRWIRRESGMERRAHRFAAMGRVLSLDLLYISPGDSTDAPEGVARSQREVQFKPWPERNGKGKQNLLAGTEIE
jgi:hypothetical protein